MFLRLSDFSQNAPEARSPRTAYHCIHTALVGVLCALEPRAWVAYRATATALRPYMPIAGNERRVAATCCSVSSQVWAPAASVKRGLAVSVGHSKRQRICRNDGQKGICSQHVSDLLVGQRPSPQGRLLWFRT